VHQFTSGGMAQIFFAAAVSPVNAPPAEGYVTITPMFTSSCAVNPTKSKFSNQTFLAVGNWSVYDIGYDIGPLPELGCNLPTHLGVEFFVPAGYDIRIASLRLAGTGIPVPNTLQSIPDLGSIPSEKKGILSNMWLVWIAIAVGTLIVLCLLLLLWYCCGKPSCCSKDTRVRTPCTVAQRRKQLHAACLPSVAATSRPMRLLTFKRCLLSSSAAGWKNFGGRLLTGLSPSRALVCMDYGPRRFGSNFAASAGLTLGGGAEST
jgi:hypothetical protein